MTPCSKHSVPGLDRVMEAVPVAHPDGLVLSRATGHTRSYGKSEAGQRSVAAPQTLIELIAAHVASEGVAGGITRRPGRAGKRPRTRLRLLRLS